MDWTLSQLRAFCAVGQLGTMTAAAENLGYTTGAISQQVSTLEANLNIKLFAKEGRSVVLTDAGVTFLVHARAILDAEQRAADSMDPRSDRHDVSVRLGVFGSSGLFAIPPMLRILSERKRPIGIHASEINLADMPQAIVDGRIDMAISVDYPDAPRPPQRGVISTPLHSETFRMIVPQQDEELCSSAAGLERYGNETDWILPPADSTFGRAMLFACARSGFHPEVRHSVNDTALSIALAESGVGITLATPLMLALRPTSASIVKLPKSASRTIVALTGHPLAHRESVQGLLSALRETFSQAQRWDEE